MPRPRRVQDTYFRRAKAEGYLARSAYKLIEIDEKFHILGGARRVIDLGCAPGSWLQVTAQRTDPGAQILGIDLKPVEMGMPNGVKTMLGDVTRLNLDALPIAPPFDVVLSDMAPNTSGSGDDLVSASLCRDVLAIVPTLLRPGGSLAMKILEGGETPGVVQETRAIFASAKLFKPQSSRDVSRETFIVAQGLRAGAPA